MNRVYRCIKCIKLQKVCLGEKIGPEIEIRDEAFIRRFQELADAAPLSKCFAGNPNERRYFVQIIGHGHVARAEVRRQYGYFKGQRVLFPEHELWNLIESHPQIVLRGEINKIAKRALMKVRKKSC